MNWVGGARSRAQQQQQQQTGGFFNQQRQRGRGGCQGNYQRQGGSGQRDLGSERPCIERRANVNSAAQGDRVGTFRGRRHVYYNAARHERLFDLSCRGDDKKYSPLLDFIDKSNFPDGASLRLQLSHELEIDRCNGTAAGGVNERIRGGGGDHQENDDHNMNFLTDDAFSDDDISLFTSDIEQERPVPRERSQGKIQLQPGLGHDLLFSSPAPASILSSSTSYHDCLEDPL